MGLAAPKKKFKYSNDPNNLRWMNNSQSFGHKILTSQGWKQGEFLGARNAAHAELHSLASTSYIRVALKDNNLGLGAKKGSGVGHGECTGLDAFKNLLGRLNGKDKYQIQKEQLERDELRRTIFSQTRFGNINFISAGYLVGDQIQIQLDSEEKEREKLIKEQQVINAKTKIINSNPSHNSEKYKLTKESKNKKKSPVDKSEVENNLLNPKKRRKLHQTTKVINDRVLPSYSDIEDFKMTCKSEETTKHDVKKRKNKKNKKNQETFSAIAEKVKTSSEKTGSKRVKVHPSIQSSRNDSQFLLNKAPEGPVTSHRSKIEPECPKSLCGRYSVRSKIIAQKKMAYMDTTSINQIFMTKV